MTTTTERDAERAWEAWVAAGCPVQLAIPFPKRRPTSEEVTAVAVQHGVLSREYEAILSSYFGSERRR